MKIIADHCCLAPSAGSLYRARGVGHERPTPRKFPTGEGRTMLDGIRRESVVRMEKDT